MEDKKGKSSEGLESTERTTSRASENWSDSSSNSSSSKSSSTTAKELYDTLNPKTPEKDEVIQTTKDDLLNNLNS